MPMVSLSLPIFNSSAAEGTATLFPVEYFGKIPSPADVWANLYDPIEPDRFIADGDTLQIAPKMFSMRPGNCLSHCCSICLMA